MKDLFGFRDIRIGEPVSAWTRAEGVLPSSLFGGGPAESRRTTKPMDAVKVLLSKISLSGDEKAMKPIVENALAEVQDTVNAL
jgi:hypothetical protein